MDVETARAILNEVKLNGSIDTLPDSEAELVNDAIYFVEEAHLAIDGGWGAGNEHLHAIVSLAKLAESQSVIHETDFREEEPPGERLVDVRQDGTNGRVPDGTEKLHTHRDDVEGEFIPPLVVEKGFPVPPVLNKPHLEMPRDITQCTDIQIRKLYSEYNGLLNRAKWQLAVETSDHNDADALMDDAYRTAYLRNTKIDDETGKAKTTALMDMEAKDNKEYKNYEEKVRGHSKNIIAWKALVDIYSSNVDRLSREMTFRQLEWEKSR